MSPPLPVTCVKCCLFSCQIESTSPSRHLSQSTFESLDALLIALSPAYASAMHDELMKRFEGGTGLERFERKWDEEEPAWID